MCALASASATLISVSRRRRASGVRRSCEIPASMMTRSSSILDSCLAMRLKPMLTSRISLVATFSSSLLASKSPSRMRLAANDSCLSGRLMRRAISAAPTSDRMAAVISQISQVPLCSGPRREGSVSSQYESPSMLKPTHTPATPLTDLATTVPLPMREVSSSPIRWPNGSLTNSWYLSPGSRGEIRTPSSSARVLISQTLVIESEYLSAARLRLTSEASCLALCTARGSNSSARKVCNQAMTLPTSNTDRNKKVRQNRLKPTRGRSSSGAGAVSGLAARVAGMRGGLLKNQKKRGQGWTPPGVKRLFAGGRLSLSRPAQTHNQCPRLSGYSAALQRPSQ